MLPWPAGYSAASFGAANGRALLTMIMDKSLPLFFYCYQSMVHLQSSLSFTLLSPHIPFFPCPFYLYLSTPAPLLIAPTAFFTLLLSVCFVRYKEKGVSFIHQSSILSNLIFLSPSVIAKSLFGLLSQQSSLSMLENCFIGCGWTRRKLSAKMDIYSEKGPAS